MKSLTDCLPVTVRSPLTDEASTFVEGLKIVGRVDDEELPIPCRVRLFESVSGRIIADVATNEFGDFKFENLVPAQFFVVAHHPQGEYPAVIQDHVVPK